MEIVPIGPGFGAELRGVSLLDVATDHACYLEVRAAFEAHSVLLFRDQLVTDDIQIAASRAFGPLELGKPDSLGAGSFLARVSNIGADGHPVPPDHRLQQVRQANALWHTDSSFLARPAMASLLTARILPAAGGETEFASTRLAWERLSPERQAQLRDLIVEHCYAHSRDRIDPNLMTPEQRRAMPPVRWRMTWRNPANGRASLYIASHAGAIRGMPQAEGRALLDDLIVEATAPGRTLLHRWREGDAVMWDNRATMHRGRPYPADQPRLMVRTTIKATEADGLAELRPPDALAA